jgi:hypothetical protein
MRYVVEHDPDNDRQPWIVIDTAYPRTNYMALRGRAAAPALAREFAVQLERRLSRSCTDFSAGRFYGLSKL